MANFHKYETQQEYNAATDRALGESHVSMVNNTILMNGANIIVPFRESALDNGDIVLYDSILNKRCAVKRNTYIPTFFDTNRYKIVGYYYGAVSGKGVVLSKETVNTSVRWAINHIYHLTPDTTASGGFSYSVSINGTTRTGSVSWEEGATLSSIVLSINSGAGMSGVSSVKDGYISLSFASYTDSNFTISEDTGVTLDDMSKYCKVNGVLQSEVHRSFQTTTVASLFPSIGWPGAVSSCYMRNGGNGSYRSGANLEKYTSYWRTNGSSSYAVETGTTIINKATFESFANSTGDEKALYDKYNGSWDAYMANRMVNLADYHSDGVDYKYFDNGFALTQKLANITTINEDGDWISAYPAASVAYNYSVEDVPFASAGN